MEALKELSNKYSFMNAFGYALKGSDEHVEHNKDTQKLFETLNNKYEKEFISNDYDYLSFEINGANNTPYAIVTRFDDDGNYGDDEFIKLN